MIIISLLVFIIVLLLVLVGFLIKALKVQLLRNDVHEKWILDLREKVIHAHRTMTTIDHQEWFSKDDDVGEVFQEIVDIIKKLNEIVE
jgi:hypothetical protein